MKLFIVILLLPLVAPFFGCAHVVSKELRDIADLDISPSLLIKEPEGYSGKIVLLGGNIVSLVNTEEGTYVEVVQKDLTSAGRPKDTDRSAGRFLILHDGYLDAAIYSSSRSVTVAGEVLGKKVRTLGEIEYPYLLIRSRELHLMAEPRGRPSVSFGIGIRESF
jgi:outer membrane lipoprotein